MRRMSAMRAAIAAWPKVGEGPVRAAPDGSQKHLNGDAALPPRSATSPFFRMLRSVPRSDNRCEAVIRGCFLRLSGDGLDGLVSKFSILIDSVCTVCATKNRVLAHSVGRLAIVWIWLN